MAHKMRLAGREGKNKKLKSNNECPPVLRFSIHFPDKKKGDVSVPKDKKGKVTREVPAEWLNPQVRGKASRGF